MALDELLRTLEAEAVARIEEVRSRARAEAERLRRNSEGELSRRLEAMLQARRAELGAAAAGEVAAARREAARRVLSAREAALARIRVRARERLAARAEDDALLPLLQRDLRRGLDFVGEGAVVRAAGPLLAGLRGSLDGRGGVTFEPAVPPRTGLVLHSADGKLTVDATLESRLDQRWPRLAVALTERLEPTGQR
jgi:vacuolar-type H+-ATPase subunit E/Vma4